MENYKIDSIDLKILNLLQADGRITKAKIAQSVNLSEVPCWRRVRYLEEAGFISSYVALVDKEKLGYKFHAFVHVKVDIPDSTGIDDFQKLICSSPEVLGFYNTTGDYDYVLFVVTRNVAGFRNFIDESLRSIACIKKINSSVVLNTIKNESNITLPEL